MSVTKSETQPKKMVRRSVAIALGIICIISVAGLSGVIVFLNGENTSLNSQVTSLQAQMASLQNQVQSLTDTLTEYKSVVLFDNQTSQEANNYTSWHFLANYSGYIIAQVTSSTWNAYIQVSWYNEVIDYHYNKTAGAGYGGWGIFPVVAGLYTAYPPPPYRPGLGSFNPTDVEIRVGNTNLINGATETVTITYYY